MKLRSVFALLLCALFAFASVAPALAQDADKPKGAAVETSQATTENKDTTMWEDLKSGGVTMIFIGLCSVATVYLIIDGLLRITSFKKTVPEEHLKALQSLFRSGDYVGAYKFCKNNPSPLTNVCKSALIMAGEGKNAAEEAVVAEISKENAQMQYFISYLSVIGVCAPMIGLLGTVFGMKDAFRTLNVSGVGDPSKLSGAISHVLICTAFGLLIAIPAFFAFYWFRNRSAQVVHNIQEAMNNLFRKFPYEHLAGAHLGDEELFAAVPNWVQQPAGTGEYAGAAAAAPQA